MSIEVARLNVLLSHIEGHFQELEEGIFEPSLAVHWVQGKLTALYILGILKEEEWHEKWQKAESYLNR